jgi:hypothetical protein
MIGGCQLALASSCSRDFSTAGNPRPSAFIDSAGEPEIPIGITVRIKKAGKAPEDALPALRRLIVDALNGRSPDIDAPSLALARSMEEEQGHALRLVSGATLHLLSVALCVTGAPVYDASGCALTVRRAAQRAEDRT